MQTNPTTLRFSRRLGEAHRGSDYANPVERPPACNVRFGVETVVSVVALAVLAAFLLVSGA